MQDSLRNPKQTRRKSRKRRSLSRKVRRAVAISCVLLGMLIQVIGITLYGLILVREYEHLASNAAKQVSIAVRHGSEFDTLTDDILSVYSAYTQAEREDMDPENYRSLYAEIEKNRPYYYLEGMLASYCKSTDVHDVSLAIPDPETGDLIVIVDAGGNAPQKPGDRKDVSARFLRAFHNWNKEDELLQYRLIHKTGLVCTVVIPVANEEGRMVAYMFVDVAMQALLADMNKFAAPITLAILLVTTLITWILVRMMRKAVVEPVNAIAGAAQTYVSDKRSGLEENNHFSGLNIQTGDEVENLSQTMADMEREILDIEKALTSATAESERISTELDMARRIQAESLPNVFPPFPERTEFDIYASMHPAKEVGGDFYDFFLLDADHLGLVIADVSGKGVPAALFMMVSKMLVQNYALVGGSPREVLEMVNNQISKNNRERMFVTIWLGILDLKTGRLTATNAGHEYPALKHPGRDFEILRDRHGMFVGVKSGIHYRDYELQMERGSKLFVYTDGVPEATDLNGQMFGMDRLHHALMEAQDEAPQRILEHVRRSIDAFVGEAPQFDDITMLCLEFRGPERPVRECELPAALESIPKAIAFAEQELQALECPVKTQSLLSVVFDEILSNIVHYAYGMGIGSVTVRIEAMQDEGGVMITFIDTGVAFNPLEAPEPDISLSADMRKDGGLGIFLARKLVDEMTYERVDGCNILRMKKRF